MLKLLSRFKKSRKILPLVSNLPCQKIIHEVVLFADYLTKIKKDKYIIFIDNEWSIPLHFIVNKIRKQLNITHKYDKISTSLQKILRDYHSDKYPEINSYTKEKFTKEICG
ncbi:hypothetical protein [Campylobacter jejuni]|uniref:hypothetical protein n=1 Tax=Campylobacter jejuni TaxID=197 RepID=UPI000F80B36F|nr:hypothetical protein [Campylobacter jejuni]